MLHALLRSPGVAEQSGAGLDGIFGLHGCDWSLLKHPTGNKRPCLECWSSAGRHAHAAMQKAEADPLERMRRWRVASTFDLLFR